MEKLDYHFNSSELIFGLRKLYQISQVDFSKTLGVSQSALSKLENGVLSPDLNTTLNLCNGLSLNINIFQQGLVTGVPKSVVNQSKKFIPAGYTANGFISAKTFFLFLEHLSLDFGIENPYKKCGINKEVFVMPSLLFNGEFLKTIYDKCVGSKATTRFFNSLYKTYGAEQTEKDLDLYNYLLNYKSLRLEKYRGANASGLLFGHLSSELEKAYVEFLFQFIRFDLLVSFGHSEDKLSLEYTKDKEFILCEA